MITVDEAGNVSFTVEGFGDTLTEKLTVSLDKDDVVNSILLKACVELEDKAEELVDSTLLDGSSMENDTLTSSLDDEIADGVETLGDASDNDETTKCTLVESPVKEVVVLWDCKIEIKLDETEGGILEEPGVTITTDSVPLTVLWDSEIATELVADSLNVEVETGTNTSDDDKIEGNTLEESDVIPTDDAELAVLCDSDGMMAKELVADFVNIKEETLINIANEDETKDRTLVEFGVTPSDAVALTVLCDSEIDTELVANGLDIKDETFANSSDDDETEGRTVVEIGATPIDAVALTVLCDSEIATELVADFLNVEVETLTNTLSDDKIEDNTLDESGVTPTDAVALAVLCDGMMAKELVADFLDIKEETLINIADEDETEDRTLVEFGVTPSDAVALTVLCDSEIATRLVADGVDIKDEALANTSENDETEGRTVVEFGVTLTGAVALTVLCDSETAKELVADGADIDDETFADTLDDNETEGRTVVEIGATPIDAVSLIVLWDSADIKDETFANTSDDDTETEGRILVEFGFKPMDAVALALLCDNEIAKELVVDGVDIEDETFADTLDDDGTKGRILVEFGVTP